MYLGFVIYTDGLKMDLDKVKESINGPIPRNVFEVRSFNGLARFYEKFINNFNSLCEPILDIIKENKEPFK